MAESTTHAPRSLCLGTKVHTFLIVEPFPEGLQPVLVDVISDTLGILDPKLSMKTVDPESQ